MAIHHWHLRDDGFDGGILMRQIKHMTTRKRYSPEADTRRIDAVMGPQCGNGGAPIGPLHGHRDMLADIAIALAKAAIIKHQRVKASRSKALAIFQNPRIDGAGQPMRHHNTGAIAGFRRW